MSGRVRVAIVDSGVNAGHEHVGNIVAGIDLRPGADPKDFTDTLGHGTAVAGVIHFLAPEAELYIVRIFGDVLQARMETALAALDWSIDNGANLVNLSLGTVNARHRAAFEALIEKGRQRGATIVSAAELGSEQALPGMLPGVVAVWPDASLPFGEVTANPAGGYRACPFPRPIPGRRLDQNLSGISFAVAHVTGHLARQFTPGII